MLKLCSTFRNFDDSDTKDSRLVSQYITSELFYYGVIGTPLKFLASYLNNKVQCT